VDVVAVAEPDDSALARAVKRFPKAQTFASWRDLRAAVDGGELEVDGVVDSGPLSERMEVLGWVLSADIPAYLEKPVASERLPPEKLWDSPLVQIGFNFRYCRPLHRPTDDAQATFAVVQSPLGRSSLSPRSMIFDLGIHSIDYLIWRFGDIEPVRARLLPGPNGPLASLDFVDQRGRVHHLLVGHAALRTHRLLVIGEHRLDDWDRLSVVHLSTSSSGSHWRMDAARRSGSAIASGIAALASRQVSRSFDPSYRLAMLDFVRFARGLPVEPFRPTLSDYRRASDVCEQIATALGGQSE